MKILFDETYASSDGQPTSRNIWYGYADISVEGEYGISIKLNEDFMDKRSIDGSLNFVCGIIHP